jgi:monofunctional biosynthetic peptidoglycan transglycosylase
VTSSPWPAPPDAAVVVPKRRRLPLVLGAVATGLLAYAAYVFAGLPSRGEVRALATNNPGPTAVMRQRMREAQKAKRPYRIVQTVVPLSQVSRTLIQAVIASEDQKFFGHEGIDWEAIQESVETNARQGRTARGGSTITQQLAKNLFFGTRKTVTRKIRELVVARWLEADLSKKRILTLYLNVAEWGDGIFGCEAAARRYYGKPAADLDLEEAAGLVAMIPAPRRINPLLSPTRHARAQRRVLWLMAHAGYIERSVAGLGTEPPPPEPALEAEDDGAPGAEEPALVPEEPELVPNEPTPVPEAMPRELLREPL